MKISSIFVTHIESFFCTLHCKNVCNSLHFKIVGHFSVLFMHCSVKCWLPKYLKILVENMSARLCCIAKIPLFLTGKFFCRKFNNFLCIHWKRKRNSSADIQSHANTVQNKCSTILLCALLKCYGWTFKQLCANRALNLAWQTSQMFEFNWINHS